MVQLKVIVAPKRVAETVISIPYGSIKSTHAIAPLRAIRIFQFLMVQLKVKLIRKLGRIKKEISIPYGSIKS